MLKGGGFDARLLNQVLHLQMRCSNLRCRLRESLVCSIWRLKRLWVSEIIPDNVS